MSFSCLTSLVNGKSNENLHQLTCRKGKINIPLLYFHRFLRLTPLLAVAVLLTMSLVRYMGSGPIWPMLIDMQREICEEEWYTTLSYIQNYVYKNDIVSNNLNLM